MRKITYLLTLLLAFVSWNSLNAQTGSSTGWYAPGERLDVTTLTAGTDVFIYSMCYLDGNTGDSDYSRFIYNDGNTAKTAVGKPASLVTNKLGYMWRVRSVETVSRTDNGVTYTGKQP